MKKISGLRERLERSAHVRHLSFFSSCPHKSQELKILATSANSSSTLPVLDILAAFVMSAPPPAVLGNAVPEDLGGGNAAGDGIIEDLAQPGTGGDDAIPDEHASDSSQQDDQLDEVIQKPASPVLIDDGLQMVTDMLSAYSQLNTEDRARVAGAITATQAPLISERVLGSALGKKILFSEEFIKS